MKRWWARRSLRDRLMLGILLPVLGFITVNTIVLYHQALRAADIAYDRTLLATAKSIGDLLEVEIENGKAQVKSTLLYSALEPFEADNRSRIYYRVTGFNGETISGFDALPVWRGQLPQQSPYAALVDFYDDFYMGIPIRVAVLLQPVTWATGQGMATVQVAETLELRETLARSLLLDTLWRQAALLLLIAAVVVFVVQRATQPVRELSLRLRSRAEGDLAPLENAAVPRELQPLVAATNHLMGRLHHLLDHQKRFVRDASHQLRTPLAVLKTQVQSARRGDVDAHVALREIGDTVDRATTLANQMLALAKVEQIRQHSDAPALDWAEIVRNVALDMSALIVERQLDFDIETRPAPVRAHEWALRELSRNLIHNAIKHGPLGGQLAIRLVTDRHHAALTVSDSGQGIGPEQRQRLFEPFAAGSSRSGSGLGLAICHEIVDTLDGQIELQNRGAHGTVEGLDATVRLPLANAPVERSTDLRGMAAR